MQWWPFPGSQISELSLVSLTGAVTFWNANRVKGRGCDSDKVSHVRSMGLSIQPTASYSALVLSLCLSHIPPKLSTYTSASALFTPVKTSENMREIHGLVSLIGAIASTTPLGATDERVSL